MPARRPLVAANWKLNGNRDSNARLVDELLSGLDNSLLVEVLVCPPFVYLSELAARLEGTVVMLGAQDVCAEAEGAFTGEISAAMLREVGARWAILGHSERRALYAEGDDLVARKFAAAQLGGLTPILCVGETLQERESGRTLEVVGRQLEAVLDHCGVAALQNAVVAYEPVWAIGTGKTATPDEAQEVHAAIRRMVAARDDRIGGGLRILYGGSVKGANAGSLFSMPDIDGGLIGGASLKAAEFLDICCAAAGQ
ncbi:MAG: triose-phosphate isomerase [Chromatiales bacterium]|nr:triose-phosphate isomerase [Chromatiales bacterium]